MPVKEDFVTGETICSIKQLFSHYDEHYDEDTMVTFCDFPS